MKLNFRLDVLSDARMTVVVSWQSWNRNGFLVNVHKLIVNAVRAVAVERSTSLSGNVQITAAHSTAGIIGARIVAGRRWAPGTAQAVQTVHGTTFLEVFECWSECTNDAKLWTKGERKQNGHGHTIRRGGLVVEGGGGGAIKCGRIEVLYGEGMAVWAMVGNVILGWLLDFCCTVEPVTGHSLIKEHFEI